MLDSNFFDQVFWGNTVKAYCLLGGIIVLGLLFKRIFSKLLSQLIFKLFKKFSDQEHDTTFVALLLKPLEFLLTLFIFFTAINQLKHPLEVTLFHYNKLIGKAKVAIPVSLGDCIDRIFLFLIILSVFWIILRIVDFVSHVFLYKASLTENKSDDQLVPFLKELFKTLVIFIGFFTLLGFVFEVNVLTLITGLGIGGIAIALAAKESLENLIGSFTIFLDKPFVVGDLVKVDGIEGTIEKVGFRSTRIRTVEKTLITIPNKGMIDGVLENMSARNVRRVKFTVGVTYETPKPQLELIVDHIREFLVDYPNTNNDGVIYFDGFGSSSLDIVIIYGITELDFAKYALIKQEINFKIMEIILGNNSDFAYPTQRLISDKTPVVEEKGTDKTDLV